jgi:hypothetical protein
MTAEPPAAIRPLTTADAPSRDDVIRSLPHHFPATRLLAMPLEVLHDEVRR